MGLCRLPDVPAASGSAPDFAVAGDQPADPPRLGVRGDVAVAVAVDEGGVPGGHDEAGRDDGAGRPDGGGVVEVAGLGHDLADVLHRHAAQLPPADPAGA